MLDLILFAFVAGFLALGLRRPFIWVLVYVYIDIVAPQKIGWTLMPAIPVSLIAFAAAFIGWAVLDSKKGTRVTFRQGLIVLLLFYCGYTTMTAHFPEDALEKWAWVWKALLFAIFMPLTLRTRTRIEATALVMVLAAGAVMISAGLKTALSGGGYGSLASLVQENAGIYEGSIMSTVAISMIPLVVWCARYNTIFPKHWTVWVFSVALIFACMLVPVGTQARTGLVCLAVLGVLTLRYTKYRFALIAAGGFAMMVAVPFLPQSFTERMATISSYQGDQSASTRVQVWKWTIDYANNRPLGGGFNVYRANSFTYETRKEVERGNTVVVETAEVTDEGRAFHSAYFEMLGEQGWVGLGIWLWIQALGLWQMEWIRRKLRKSDDKTDQSFVALADALLMGHIVYLVGALFVGVAFQPFIFMLIALQIALTSLVKRRTEEAKAAERRLRRNARRDAIREAAPAQPA